MYKKEGKEYLNSLPTEVKLLIVKANALVENTRQEVKAPELHLDLTSRLQLRDDCKAIDDIVKLFAKGKGNQKLVKRLELAVASLETTSHYILGKD